MKLHTRTMLAATVTAALTAGPAWPQTGPPSGTPGSATGAATAPGTSASASTGQLARADRDFVMDAAMAGMVEVESSRIAVNKASSPAVKQFAQRMIDDHTRANTELTTFAQGKGLTPPAEVDRSHRKAIEGLEKRSGEDFDRAYMKMQVSDHEKTVSRFEKQARSGKDPELKQWAEAKLPALRQHLQMARGGDASARGTSTPGAASTQGATSSGSMSSSATTSPGGAPGAPGSRSGSGAAGPSGVGTGASGTGSTGTTGGASK